jgi:hypothetical protein
VPLPADDNPCQKPNLSASLSPRIAVVSAATGDRSMVGHDNVRANLRAFLMFELTSSCLHAETVVFLVIGFDRTIGTAARLPGSKAATLLLKCIPT